MLLRHRMGHGDEVLVFHPLNRNGMVIVCFFYGFAHRLFSMETAFLICCVNYVLDAVISLASMASNVYVQDLSDNADEVKTTISTGVSINHLVSIFIALCGGWIWETLGIETLFIVSAVLGLGNSAYARQHGRDVACGHATPKACEAG